MYLYLLLLLLSCRASSYFIPPKEMPFLQTINKTSIIKEILCLLHAENKPLNGFLEIPTSLKDPDCAHWNTDKFICQLNKLNVSVCMTTAAKDMKELERSCLGLKNKTNPGKKCSGMGVDFSQFKNTLEEFLKWVNEWISCSSIVRSEVDLNSNNCTCPRLRRYRKGWP